jgi:hypothetical protein
MPDMSADHGRVAAISIAVRVRDIGTLSTLA